MLQRYKNFVYSLLFTVYGFFYFPQILQIIFLFPAEIAEIAESCV